MFYMSNFFAVASLVCVVLNPCYAAQNDVTKDAWRVHACLVELGSLLGKERPDWDLKGDSLRRQILICRVANKEYAARHKAPKKQIDEMTEFVDFIETLLDGDEATQKKALAKHGINADPLAIGEFFEQRLNSIADKIKTS